MYSIVAIAKAKLKSVGLSQVYFVFLKGQFFVMKILLLRVFNIYTYIFQIFWNALALFGTALCLKKRRHFLLKKLCKNHFPPKKLKIKTVRLSWKRQQFSFKNICKNHYFKFVNQKKLKIKTVTQPWAFPGQRSVMYLKFVLDNDFTYLYKWPFYIYILQYLFFVSLDKT